MNPEDIQAPQETPQDPEQDKMIIDFLQELDDRITALEDKEKGEPKDE